MFAATIAELPNDGPTVRQLVALYARHVALAAFWTGRANAAGAGTEEGVVAADRSIKHDLRAERLASSYLTAAKSLANKTGDVIDCGALFGKAK